MSSTRTVNARGENTVSIVTPGHQKSRFIVFLCSHADGTKLKPMIIFKRKTQPKEKFSPYVVIHHHPKGWIDEDGLKLWIEEVVDRGSLEIKTWRVGEQGKSLRLGIISCPPCRSCETCAAPNRHRCRS